jgi:hypothetical protein
MGCGEACPLVPGKHDEDWELDDPAGKTVEEIRRIRDEIRDVAANLIENVVKAKTPDSPTSLHTRWVVSLFRDSDL